MSIPVVRVAVTLYELPGVPMVGARVTARLSTPIIYEGVVVPQFEGATTDSAGQCVLSLVPTSLASEDVSYSVEIWPAYAPEPTVFSGLLVPNVPTITLEELLGGSPAGGRTLIFWDGPAYWDGGLHFGELVPPAVDDTLRYWSSDRYWGSPVYFGEWPNSTSALIYWTDLQHWSSGAPFGQYVASTHMGYWAGPLMYGGSLLWS